MPGSGRAASFQDGEGELTKAILSVAKKKNFCDFREILGGSKVENREVTEEKELIRALRMVSKKLSFKKVEVRRALREVLERKHDKKKWNMTAQEQNDWVDAMEKRIRNLCSVINDKSKGSVPKWLQEVFGEDAAQKNADEQVWAELVGDPDEGDEKGDVPDEKGTKEVPDEKGDVPDEKGEVPDASDEKGENGDEEEEVPDEKGKKVDENEEKGDEKEEVPDEKGKKVDESEEKGDEGGEKPKGDAGVAISTNPRATFF